MFAVPPNIGFWFHDSGFTDTCKGLVGTGIVAELTKGLWLHDLGFTAT